MSSLVKLLMVVAVIVFLIAIGPLAFIWSWNTLFGSALAIEYTFWTWLAAAVFMAVLAPNVRISKSS